MKKMIMTMILGMGLTGVAMAQVLPPAPNNQGPGQNDGPPDQGPGGPGGGGPGLGPGGPGGGPRMLQRNNPIEAMRNYVELIQKYTEMAKDQTAASVAAVVAVTELSRSQGPTVAAERLTKLLEVTNDAAVKRAIRLQLIDLYKVSKQEDKALEQAELLIKQ